VVEFTDTVKAGGFVMVTVLVETQPFDAVTVTVYVPGARPVIVYVPPTAVISDPPGLPFEGPVQLTLKLGFPLAAVTKMDPVPPLHVGCVGTAVDEHVLQEAGAVYG
jgi:hypothetical protein